MIDSSLAERQWHRGSWLDRLSTQTVDSVLAAGRPVRFLPEAVMLAEGDTGRHVLVITRGFVKVEAGTAAGERAVLSVRTAGDVIGEMAALNDERRSATAISCSPVTARVLTQPVFLRILKEHPEANRCLNIMLGDRLRWANRRRVDFSGTDGQTRLKRVVLDLALRFGRQTEDGCHVDIRLTQADLASLAGVGLATAERGLRQLDDQGVIRRFYRSFVVLDLPLLAVSAGAPIDPDPFI